MSHGLFDVFSKMVADLPARAIPTALDLQCQMLEEDAINHRLASVVDASSIQYFRQFLQTAKSGKAMQRPKPLPPDHIEFFKETVLRLIQAEELPPLSMGQFDDTFVHMGFS